MSRVAEIASISPFHEEMLPRKTLVWTRQAMELMQRRRTQSAHPLRTRLRRCLLAPTTHPEQRLVQGKQECAYACESNQGRHWLPDN